MKVQGRRLAGLAFSALLLSLAACGGGGGSSDGATETEPRSTVTISDSPMVTAGDTTPATVAPPSGSITVGVATDLQTLDPHLAQPAQLHYLDLVYDALTKVGTSGAVEPNLASSLTSDDLTTWTATIADGATFSDGTPVDAAAVVYSLDRGKATTESPSAPLFAQIDSVEATDDSTVTIVLTAPNVAFARDMAGLAGMIVNPASEGSDLSRAPAGAGPFTYDTSGSVEGSEYKYDARTDYWGTGVGVEHVSLQLIIDPSARVNALVSGQIDIAAELGPADQTKVGDAEVVLAPTSEQLYIQVIDSDGSKVPALGDPLVRQAMSYAIDREGVNKAIMLGGGIPTTAWFAEGSPYYLAEVDGVGYDLDRARELLADAGYADGFEFDTPTVEALRPVTEAVAGSLAQIGIKMNIKMQQPGTLGQQVRDGQWAASLTITRGQTPPVFYSERLTADAPFNPFNAQRTTVTDLGEQALAATTEAEAASLWAQTYAEAVKQGYMIVVAHVTTGAGVASGVSGAQVLFGSLIPDLRSVRVDG